MALHPFHRWHAALVVLITITLCYDMPCRSGPFFLVLRSDTHIQRGWTCNDIEHCASTAQVRAVVSVRGDDGVLKGGRRLQTHNDGLLAIIPAAYR